MCGSCADNHPCRVLSLSLPSSADIPPNQNLPEVPPSPPPRSKLPSKRFTPPEPIKISLADHGLAPSSVLSIRFVDSALNGSEMRAPLREELLERAEELPVPAGTPTPSTATASPTATPVPDKPEPAKAGGGKMPKWFKGPGSEFGAGYPCSNVQG